MFRPSHQARKVKDRAIRWKSRYQSLEDMKVLTIWDGLSLIKFPALSLACFLGSLIYKTTQSYVPQVDNLSNKKISLPGAFRIN